MQLTKRFNWLFTAMIVNKPWGKLRAKEGQIERKQSFLERKQRWIIMIQFYVNHIFLIKKIPKCINLWNCLGHF